MKNIFLSGEYQPSDYDYMEETSDEYKEETIRGNNIRSKVSVSESFDMTNNVSEKEEEVEKILVLCGGYPLHRHDSSWSCWDCLLCHSYNFKSEHRR